MEMTLTRFCYSERGTFGTLVGPDGTNCYTVERPWVHEEGYIGGKPFESCIPEGRYMVSRTSRPSHKRTFSLVNELLGVYDRKQSAFTRYGILIHVGNTYLDVVGCISPGMILGTLYSKSDEDTHWAVLNSRAAFNNLWNETAHHETWDLEIRGLCKPEGMK